MVGFYTTLRKRLASLEDTCDPMALQNNHEEGKVLSGHGNLLNPATQVVKSPKKFNEESITKTKSGKVTITKIQNKSDYDKISVKAKC